MEEGRAKVPRKFLIISKINILYQHFSVCDSLGNHEISLANPEQKLFAILFFFYSPFLLSDLPFSSPYLSLFLTPSFSFTSYSSCNISKIIVFQA